MELLQVKIVKNYLYTMSYQIFIFLVPVITIPYISRTIGTDGIGLNAYTSSIISYFTLLANYGLSLYGSRTIAFYRDEKYQMSKKFWEIVIAKIIMMAISLIFFFIYLSIISEYRYILLLQGIQILATGIDISWFFIGIEDFKSTVTRSFIVRIISIVIIFLLVHDSQDLAKYILIVGGSSFIGNLTLWPYTKQKIFRIDIKIVDFFSVLIAGGSLFLPALTATLFISFNRILLGSLSTFTQTSFFDNSDKVVRIFLSLLTAVGTVIFPRIANHFKKGELYQMNRYIEISVSLVSCLSFPIVFGIILVSDSFSRLFYGSNFAGISIVLSILSIELIFMGWSQLIGQQYMIVIGKAKELTISMLSSFLICSIAAFFLIPHYGAAASAVISVIGEALMFLIQIYVVRKYINILNLFKEVWKYMLASSVMFVFCLFLKGKFHFYSDVFQILLIGFSGVAVYILVLLLLKPKSIKTLWELTRRISK